MGGGVREIGGKRGGSFAFALNKPRLPQHKINTLLVCVFNLTIA
jgi:hypothetical protein